MYDVPSVQPTTIPVPLDDLIVLVREPVKNIYIGLVLRCMEPHVRLIANANPSTSPVVCLIVLNLCSASIPSFAPIFVLKLPTL